jgi:glutamine---fructose-6-phosphate transaminase (isomerizing)
MCGIIGILGRDLAAPRALEVLKRLEYRGYDSAGIATLVDGAIARRRAEGKLVNLARLLDADPLPGMTGIGHTRWATHGAPVESNAHPHATDLVAVVHNGIIENYQELRSELEGKGVVFRTETDTETVAQLVTFHLREGCGPVEAVEKTLCRLCGAYALAIMFRDDEDLLIGARRGSPLAIGYGEGEMYLGSDGMALAPLTSRVTYLEEGDWVILRRNDCDIRDASGRRANRPVNTVTSAALVDKGNHRHFMAKEIFEQAETLSHAATHYVDPASGAVTLGGAALDFENLPQLTLTACGTAFYAASVAKYWFEQLARQAANVDIASEFRYRSPPLIEGGLTIVISQSGETADTLAALRHAKEAGQKVAAIVNVPESTIAREADIVLPTLAGPEIGVASTKAFTAQLTVLAALAVAAGQARGHLTEKQARALGSDLLHLPGHLVTALNQDGKVAALGHELSHASDVLYLGRGITYPIALEGALKLKEISYIHAEGYAAGELKHGPIALIDENVPVVTLAPPGPLFEKTVSNMEEVIARGGRMVLISDAAGIRAAGARCWRTLELPEIPEFLVPMIYAVPVQLIAYHTAVAKGTDVDQPRNLAKAVTVE